MFTAHYKWYFKLQTEFKDSIRIHCRNGDISKNRRVTLINSEFFIYSGNLQQPEKENFLELLLQRGILTAIEVLLQSEYGAIRTYGSELICQITELNQQPSVVRDHIMKAHRVSLFYMLVWNTLQHFDGSSSSIRFIDLICSLGTNQGLTLSELVLTIEIASKNRYSSFPTDLWVLN